MPPQVLCPSRAVSGGPIDKEKNMTIVAVDRLSASLIQIELQQIGRRAPQLLIRGGS